MRRVKSTVCLGLLFLSFGTIASPTFGGDDKNQANWDKLKQLSVGQDVQVVQNDAKSNRSSFRSVTDEAIVVSTATGEQTISRQSILRVSSKGKGHRVRNALIGAGIGAGGGAGIGAVVGRCGQGEFCIGPTHGEVIGGTYCGGWNRGRHCRSGASHRRLARDLSRPLEVITVAGWVIDPASAFVRSCRLAQTVVLWDHDFPKELVRVRASFQLAHAENRRILQKEICGYCRGSAPRTEFLDPLSRFPPRQMGCRHHRQILPVSRIQMPSYRFRSSAPDPESASG